MVIIVMYVTGGDDDYCNDDHVMIGDYIHNEWIIMYHITILQPYQISA